MVLSISIVSTTPAALVVISSVKGSPAVVTEKLVPEASTAALGVIFSPVHLVYAPPKTSCSIVSSISTWVTVVDCIDP